MLYGERNSPVTMIFRRGNLSVPGGEQIVVTLLRAVPGGGPQRRAAATPEDPHRLQAAAPNVSAGPRVWCCGAWVQGLMER
eukprot:2783842-Rhodomonas_salina.1